MTTIQRSALLPYPADKLFALVNDIESYPHYMDGCVRAEILCRDDTLVEARLHLARAGIAHSFATRNRNHGDHTIELELLDGPFESFNGRWQFQQLGDTACKVSLDLDFTLSNSILGAAAARLFDSITANMVDAVTRRARELYG
jgi:ribosome-associated toxin RatA of RatAB toxin-antitoxin module